MPNAPQLWYGACAALTLIWLVVGVLDLLLFLRQGQPATVSAWLRKRPARFFWPLGILLAALFALAVHLFVYS